MRPLHGHLSGLRAATLVFGLLALSTAIAVRAQQPPPAAAPAKPLVPMAASSIALNPDAHIGENVSIMATVDQILSPTAFTVDQDPKQSTGKDVLVLARMLSAPVQLNAYVTVQGELFKFDPAEVAKRAKDLTLDLTPELIEKYRGRPALIATSVVDAKLTDLAKRLPPPMTPAEMAFSANMKQVQTSFGALRQALDGSNLDTTKQNAGVLRKTFTDVQAFFKGRGTADATGWAGDVLKHVDAIEQAATGGKWDDAKTSAASLQQMCTTCHTAHRERFDDGSYRIKGM